MTTKLKQRARKRTAESRGENLTAAQRREVGEQAAIAAVRQALELDTAEGIEVTKRKKNDDEKWPVFTYSDDGLDFVIRRIPVAHVASLPIYRVNLVTGDEDVPERPVGTLADIGLFLDDAD